ncbi:MAG: cupredoxin domain-containing protein [Stenotrophobium sp.]
MKMLHRSTFALLMLSAGIAQAAPAEFNLSIRNHRYEPAELTVPAGQKIKLMVHNLDATAEEFESYQLNREKVVPGGQSVPVFIGPLDAGVYPFFGDFHQDTAQGKLIAK